MQEQRQVESTTAPFNIHKITQVLVFRKYEVYLEPNFSFINIIYFHF